MKKKECQLTQTSNRLNRNSPSTKIESFCKSLYNQYFNPAVEMKTNEPETDNQSNHWDCIRNFREEEKKREREEENILSMTAKVVTTGNFDVRYQFEIFSP